MKNCKLEDSMTTVGPNHDVNKRTSTAELMSFFNAVSALGTTTSLLAFLCLRMGALGYSLLLVFV